MAPALGTSPKGYVRFLQGDPAAADLASRHGPEDQHHHPRCRGRHPGSRVLRAARLGSRVHRRGHRHVPSRPDGRLAVGPRKARRRTAASPRPVRCGAASPSGTPSRTRTSVDALCRDAVAAGATVTSPPQDKGFGYSRRLRGSRRAHVGGRVDRGTGPARRRHRGAAVMTLGPAAHLLPFPARCAGDLLVRAGLLGVQGAERPDVRRQRHRHRTARHQREVRSGARPRAASASTPTWPRATTSTSGTGSPSRSTATCRTRWCEAGRGQLRPGRDEGPFPVALSAVLLGHVPQGRAAHRRPPRRARGPCRTCLFWRLDPVSRDRVDDEVVATEKEAWVSQVLRDWGSCGRVILVDDLPVGYLIYAPEAFVPGRGVPDRADLTRRGAADQRLGAPGRTPEAGSAGCSSRASPAT